MLAQNVMGQNEAPVDQELNLPPNTDSGFIPYQEPSVFTGRSSGQSTSGERVESCLQLMRQEKGTNITDPEMVAGAARKQTRGAALAGLGFSAGSGVAAGLVTGNPVVGAGVFGVMGLATVVGTSIERSKIKKTGNLMSAANKIKNGYALEDLTKKERRAFNKTRKKVSKKAYGDKNVLSDVEFAKTVDNLSEVYPNSPHGLSGNPHGEHIFCDTDRKDRVVIRPYDRETTKRLVLAQKCEDDKRALASGK
jgi:hypothetical protein